MALLDQETKNALTQYLTRLAGPIELVTALDDSERAHLHPLDAVRAS